MDAPVAVQVARPQVRSLVLHRGCFVWGGHRETRSRFGDARLCWLGSRPLSYAVLFHSAGSRSAPALRWFLGLAVTLVACSRSATKTDPAHTDDKAASTIPIEADPSLKRTLETCPNP